MASVRKGVEGNPKWQRVLHCIGYVTTALIAMEILLVGFLAGQEWLKDRERRLARIEDSSTHEGPITASKDDIVRSSAVYLFNQLPPLSALHGDGIRFVAMPSFNKSHVAIAIYMPSVDAANAEGVISSFDGQNNYSPMGTRHFEMPAPAYRSLVTKMEKLTDGWRGTSEAWLDGTPTAIEIVRGNHVTSSIGNSPGHYDQIAGLMLTYLKRYAPGVDLPARGDWEPS